VHNAESSDFTTGEADCRALKFTRQSGIQRKCTFIGIIDDKSKEGTEQFSVHISSSNPYVTFDIQRAMVTIEEGEIDQAGMDMFMYFLNVNYVNFSR